MSDLNVKLKSPYIGAVYLSMTLSSRCRVNIINFKSTMPWIEALRIVIDMLMDTIARDRAHMYLFSV